MLTNVTRNVVKVEWVISKRYSFDDMRIYCKEGFWEIGMMSWESKFGIYSHFIELLKLPKVYPFSLSKVV